MKAAVLVLGIVRAAVRLIAEIGNSTKYIVWSGFFCPLTKAKRLITKAIKATVFNKLKSRPLAENSRRVVDRPCNTKATVAIIFSRGRLKSGPLISCLRR